MAITLYCRHVDCQRTYLSKGGQRPAICEACGKVAAWATAPAVGLIPTRPTVPIDGWKVSENDRKFLRSLRINPEV